MALRHRVASKAVLEHYGLDRLVEGKPVRLYHGTTRMFTKFSMSYAREELVNDYYGAALFFSPVKAIAWDYAQANRNIGFEPSIIEDMKRVNLEAGLLMEGLYSKGSDAWDDVRERAVVVYPDINPGDAVDKLVGVDPNTVMDVAGYIIGSKEVAEIPEDINFFHSSTGTPGYIYDNLDELGLDSKQYRPKVYIVTVKLANVLVTDQKSEARSAKSKGYDGVVYFGTGIVKGVPEVAVYDPNNVKIVTVEF